MSDHSAETVGEMFMLWKATEKAFLEHLLVRIMSDLPDFNHEKFSHGLHLLQEEWPIDRTTPETEIQGVVSLKFLGELIEVTETAISVSRTQ